ncbi:MAG TPA: helix-turn-helix domain-containing protein [Rhizomicrobium sp.]|jgi:AraC-like DNA-binding protein|nr:helix-turn-helix domain-containing protein [Rhizomicrobium sp.]
MTSSLPNRAQRLERHSRSRPPSSLFRTHAIDRTERFAAWRESQSVFLDSSLSADDDAAAFSGDIESYLLDDVMLTRAVAGRQKYDRAPAKIARDGLDHYMIQVFFGGHTEVDMGRHRVRSEPGRAIAFDLGEVLDSYNAAFDIVCIVVPRVRLAPLLTRPDSLQASMSERDGAAGRLFVDYLSSLYRVAPSLTPPEARTASRALLDLAACAFNRTGAESAMAAREHALLLKAMRFIRDNLASPELSPEAVALGVGLSRTALYRLFEQSGGIAGYIRELRLRRCHNEIASLRNIHRRIADIADGWGFTNAAHFSRAFRTRFGRTPVETRGVLDPAVRGRHAELDPRVGDRRYEEWIAALA